MQADVAVARPAGVLADAVSGYRGSRFVGLNPGSHLGLPSPWLTMIVSLGAPTDVTQMPDPSRRAGTFAALVGGLQERAAVVSFGSEIHCVSIEVSPLAARSLFGCPASALTNEVVDAAAVFGAEGSRLADRVHDQSRWHDRFGVLDDHLSHATKTSTPGRPRGELTWAWRELAATRGATSVESLATEIGWSRRHFSAQFTDEFGIAPRTAKRLFRFHAAVKLLEADPGLGLARVAIDCGYSDQSHMTNDFASFAGTSPQAWMKSEFPNVQDPGATVGTQSTA